MGGKSGLLGTSQRSVFIEASLERTKVTLKTGDAFLSFLLRLWMHQEVWKQISGQKTEAVLQ